MNKYDLYCQLARDTYQNQNDRRKDFSRRAISIVSFSVGLVAAGVLMFGWSLSTYKLDPGTTSLYLFIAMLVVFGIIAVSSAKILWPIEWKVSPRPEDLQKHLDYYEDEGITIWVGDEYNRSIQFNRSQLRWISIALDISLCCLLVQAALLATLPFFLF